MHDIDVTTPSGHCINTFASDANNANGARKQIFRHLKIHNCGTSNEGLKMAGVYDFDIHDNDFKNTKSTLIDGVGCHNGVIRKNTFSHDVGFSGGGKVRI